MKLNSSDKDVELPLLGKNKSSSNNDHLLESQTPFYGKLKYLDVSVVNRMLFSWVTSIIQVILFLFFFSFNQSFSVVTRQHSNKINTIVSERKKIHIASQKKLAQNGKTSREKSMLWSEHSFGPSSP